MTTLDLPDENAPKKKNLLLVDIYAQLLILAVSGILAIYDVFAGLCGFYLVLGGYQLISSLIHLGFKPLSGMRKAYYPQLIIHLIVLGIGLAGGLIAVMYVELFATAITAFYYFTVTIVDLVEMKRQLR